MLDPASPSLRKLAKETAEFGDNLKDTADVAKDVKDVTEKIRKLMEIPDHIVKNSNKVHKLFDKVEKMAKTFSKVGATKPVARVVEEVVGALDEQIQKIETTAKKLQKKFEKPIEKMEKAEAKMEDIETVLKYESQGVKFASEKFDVASVRLDNARVFVDAFDRGAIDVDEDFEDKLLAVRERLAGPTDQSDLGGLFGFVEFASKDASRGLDTVNRGFDVIRDLVDKLSIGIPSFDFDIVLDFSLELNALADLFDTLLSPLRAVYDAVGDVLDALGSIFGWILAPFEFALDAVLEATGILDLIEDLKDELTGLLPDFSFLEAFDLSFLDKFNNLFENPFANIEFAFDGLIDYFELPNLDFPNVVPDIDFPDLDIPELNVPHITLPFDIPGIDVDLDIPVPQLPWFMSTILGPATAGDDVHLGLLRDDGISGQTIGPTRGDDFIVGGDADDSIGGGEGSDILIGGRGDDTLDGGDGEDIVIYSGSIEDYAIVSELLEGATTTEWIIGDFRDAEEFNDGIDRLIGIEMVIFSDAFVPVGSIDSYIRTQLEDGEKVFISPEFSELDVELPDGTFVNQPTFDLPKGDWVFGSIGAEIIEAGEGKDRLTSFLNGPETQRVWKRPGDELNGDEGNDVFIIGDGSAEFDIIRGGDDIDTIDFDAETTHGLNVYMPTGQEGALFRPASVFMHMDFDGREQADGLGPRIGVIQGVEHINGTRFADGFWGDFKDNRIDGGAGNDTLRGLGGNDTLIGGGGEDHIVGDDGDDQMYGGADADEFIAGLGNDLIDAGASLLDTVFYSLGTRSAGYSAEPDFVDYFDTGDFDNNNYDLPNGIYVHAPMDRPGVQLISKYADGRERGVRLGEDTVLEAGHIVGSDGDDVITVATDRHQRITAGAGDDLLFGGYGLSSSRLRGGLDDDRFFSQNSAEDFMQGDEGSDTWVFSGSRGVAGDTIFGDNGGVAALEGVDVADFSRSHYSWHIYLLDGTGLGTAVGKHPIARVDSSDPRFIQPTLGVDGVEQDGPTEATRPGVPRDLRSADPNTPDPGGRADRFGEFEIIFGSEHRDIITVGSPDGAITVHGNGGADVLFGSQVAGDALYGGDGDDVLGTVNQWANSDPRRSNFDAGILTQLFGGDGGDLFVAGDARERHVGGDGIDELTFESSRTVSGNANPSNKGLETRRQAVQVDLETGVLSGGYAEGDLVEGIENVTGSEGDDEISGNGLVNLLIGWNGDDTLRGRGGNDALFGNDGDDALYGGDGFDSLHGGAGGDLLDGGDGIDIASWAFYQQHPKGGAEALAGDVDGVAADLLTGQAGGDTLVDIENLHGSAGDDALSGDNGDNAIAGADGDDVLSGRGGEDVLTGGRGDDELFGDDGDDWLSGGAGTNTLDGGADRDTIDYGIVEYGITVEMAGVGGRVGLDTGSVASHVREDWTVWNDSVTEIQDPLGAPGAMILTGTDETRFTRKLVSGGSDDDPSNDIYSDDAAITPERIFRFINPEFSTRPEDLEPISSLPRDFDLEPFQDIRIIDRYEAALDLFKNIEVIVGGLGDDDFLGNDEDTEFHGSAGADLIRGGLGGDTASYLGSFEGVRIDLLAGTAFGGDAQGDVLSGIEHLRGSYFDDDLRGDAEDNRLIGEAGDDSVFGGAGEDTAVFDMASDAVIVSRAGDGVRMILADGESVISNDYVSDDVEVFEFSDVTLSRADVAGLILTGGDLGETLSGTPIADFIEGGGGDDQIDGLAGDDELLGQLDDDVLVGGRGADTLRGGPGEDQLFGGEGNDRLDGGADRDSYAGGEGNDLYVVDDAQEIILENAGEGMDTVLSSVDFTLPDEVENLTLTGDQPLNGVGNGLDNRLVGNGAGNRLEGLAGADTLDGGGGRDEMIGGTGDDVYVIGFVDETLVELLGEGVDEVRSTVSFELAEHFEGLTLLGADDLDAKGNAADNTLAGNAGDNTLEGFGGDDVFRGSAGDDVILGGAEIDTVVYAFDRADAKYDFDTPGVAFVERLDGIDRIEGVEFFQFDDVLLSTDELRNSLVPKADVRLTGASSSDAYFTSTVGIDNSREGGGAQFLYAGTASQGANKGNEFRFATAQAGGAGLGKLQGTGFNRIELGIADKLQVDFPGAGSSNLNVDGFRKPLLNMLDADWAFWETNIFNGDDTMTGAYADDVLVGYAGDDVMFGGKGDKEGYDVTGSSPSVRPSTLRNPGEVVDDPAFYINDGDDDLYGELGDDLLDGGTGNDRLFGGRGDDQLWGGAVSNRSLRDDPEASLDTGADELYGGVGDDTLHGGGGDDLLDGGEGADVFVLALGMGHDTATDFVDGEDVVDDSGLSQEERDAVTETTNAAGDRIITLSDGSTLTLLAPGNAEPEGAVRIVGEAVQGGTLGADASAVTDADGLGPITWQWRRDGVDVPGADAQTYALTQGDVGARITVAAIFTDGAGTAESVVSDETPAVANVNDAPVGEVEAEGPAQAGAVLTARPQALDDPDGIGQLRFEWRRDGRKIAGQEEESYEVDDGDIGSEISVAVSWTDNFGNAETAVSRATAAVTPQPIVADPVAQDDAFSVSANSALTGDVIADNGAGADSDVEPSDTLSVTGLNGAARPAGAVTLASGARLTLRANGTFDYDPNGAFAALAAGAAAADAFSYTLTDQGGLADVAEVSITVQGVNDAPVARNDAFSVAEDAPLAGDLFAANGSGPDADPDDGAAIAVVEVGGSAAAVGTTVALASGAGLLVLADGTFTYDQAGAFDDLDDGQTGSESFTYRISDGDGSFASATVSISVQGATDAPVPTNGPDELSGAGGRDVIDGGRGNDSISGGGGNDRLIGGGGKDRLEGGGGKDRMNGGGGNDRMDGGGGNDRMDGDGGKDRMQGRGGNDRIDGGGGNDDIAGQGGNDRIKGQGGKDDLKGGGGNDRINGGGGADDINGGKGKDRLKGGGGNDDFEFQRGDGRDVIQDFRLDKDDIHILKGANNFKQLDIYQKGKHAFVDYGKKNDVIKLLKTDADELDAMDFIF